MQIDKEKIEKRIKDKISSGIKTFGNNFEIEVLEILGLYKLTIPEKEEQIIDREIPLVKWNDYHVDPTVSALRNLWSRRKENGFDYAVERRGTRLIINERKYFEWKKMQQIKS